MVAMSVRLGLTGRRMGCLWGRVVIRPVMLIGAFALTSPLAGKAPADTSLAGDWIAMSAVDSTDGAPYSVFELHLKVRGRELSGAYCYVARYGAKIDCDPEGENVSGTLSSDGRDASVEFDSTFGATSGKAQLSLRGQKLTWKLLKAPKGGAYFGPDTEVLVPEDRQEKRCGWVSVAGRGRPLLKDGDGTWTLVLSEGESASVPARFASTGWTSTRRDSGFGCACAYGTVNRGAAEIRQVKEMQTRPMKICRSDRSLGPAPG